MNVFPAQWKISRICLISKVRNPVQMTDYRPISVLPAMSKAYEKSNIEAIISIYKEDDTT